MVLEFCFSCSQIHLRKQIGVRTVLRISQLKINISEFYDRNKEQIETSSWQQVFGTKEQELVRKKAARQLHCRTEEMKQFRIVKRSIDARKKQEIYYNYCVEVSLQEKQEKRILEKEKKNRIVPGKQVLYAPKNTGEEFLSMRPVVVGLGPAGLFCALELAKAGFCPIVVEQGQDVDTRREQVEEFWNNGKLSPESNVQFGEGGAGTFSDGKLNTLVKDVSGRNKKVLETFVEHGADSEILYMQKPHIGTDKLCHIVKSIRKEIIALGGEVRFGTKLTDLKTGQDGSIQAVCLNDTQWLETKVLVLAIGHSARETFSLLKKQNLAMEQKPFAIGVRIEHKQHMIDKNQYGELAGILPAADYKLTYQASNGRSIFSFCMCPGGFVVNASSQPEHLVVNGMSNHDRGEENANSAIVVNIVPEDFGSSDVLAGVEFQRKWEHAAYEIGKGKIPTQLFSDFKKKQCSTSYGQILPTQKGTQVFGNLWDCLPSYVCDTLVEGIEAFDRRIKGYADQDAVLSGVETRTSSPVRILRNEQLESNVEGIYPCGEGAGYAGGITSAAMDGLRVYEAIIEKYKPKYR